MYIQSRIRTTDQTGQEPGLQTGKSGRRNNDCSLQSVDSVFEFFQKAFEAENRKTRKTSSRI